MLLDRAQGLTAPDKENLSIEINTEPKLWISLISFDTQFIAGLTFTYESTLHLNTCHFHRYHIPSYKRDGQGSSQNTYHCIAHSKSSRFRSSKTNIIWESLKSIPIF